MKVKLIQTIFVAAVSLLLWVIPSNVSCLIARNRDVPPVGELRDDASSRLDMKENVFQDFGQKESIDFTDFTEPLREKTPPGEQLYFTCDDHWMPLGHEVVADTTDTSVKPPAVPTRPHTGTDYPE